MGTHFQERSGSLENGLCVTWSGFWVCPGYLLLLILVAVEQIYDHITRRLVAQRVAPAARVILSETPSFRRWRLLMETMAYWQQVSLPLPRCSYLFVLQRPRTLVPQGPHSSKNLSSRKCTPNDIPRRVGPREEICSVDLKQGDCKLVVNGGRALQPCRYRWCTHMTCIIIYPYSTYPCRGYFHTQ